MLTILSTLAILGALAAPITATAPRSEFRARTPMSAFASGVVQPGAHRQEWQTTWDALLRLRNVPVPDEERAELRAALDRRLRAAADGPRRRLLAELLARLDGRAPRVLAPEDLGLQTRGREVSGVEALAPAEAWLAAEVLAPGHARVAATVAALEGEPLRGDGVAFGSRLRLVWQVGVDEARAGRHALALDVQSRLYAQQPAAWSAMDLALTQALVGASAEADAVLAGELERAAAAGEPVEPELWNRRGLVALGAGHERRARDYLGRALRLGSDDAAVVLARLDLLRGDLEGARRGFRALSWRPDPGAWAQRGYGLALLPPRPNSE